MKELLLIDANALTHRAFPALPPLTTAEGAPGNALYGVSSILLKVWKENPPEYAAACFDRPEDTYRDVEYAEYKGKRPPTADDLVPQLIAARDLFPHFGIRTFEMAGYEADDLIGTLACAFAEEKEVQVVILTGDRDTLQLVRGEKVVVKMPLKGVSDTITYDEAAVKEKYALLPKQLIDYKALVGDASDNIKGVPGIGPKTATTLLQKYATLEAALASEDSDAEKLRANRAAAEQAKRLVTLQCEAPVGVADIGELEVRNDPTALEEYFLTLGFPSLAKRISEEKKPGKTTKKAPHPSQGSIF